MFRSCEDNRATLLRAQVGSLDDFKNRRRFLPLHLQLLAVPDCSGQILK